MRFLAALLVMSLASLSMADGVRPELNLRSDLVSLSIDLGGGSIKSFSLTGNGLNPLSWDSWLMGADPNAVPSHEPRSMGHFVCLDRWGPPSESEKHLGMPKHGEAANVWWKIESQAEGFARMSAVLPLAGLRVEREIRIQDKSALFEVREKVSNTRHLGRIYNIVQHPTIGVPFLDESVIVDCNGTHGVMQDRPMPHPEEEEVFWPKAVKRDGTEVDVGRLYGEQAPNVVSYVVEDGEIGWITAYSEGGGLLLGYVWPREDYPWISMWRHVEGGKPFARGLEFGTTGLHQTEAVLAEKKEIFGEALFRYIKAEESQAFSYAAFLLETPLGFKGVESIRYEDDLILLKEKGGKQRLKLQAKGLFEK